jgi:hypothetical protein
MPQDRQALISALFTALPILEAASDCHQVSPHLSSRISGGRSFLPAMEGGSPLGSGRAVSIILLKN